MIWYYMIYKKIFALVFISIFLVSIASAQTLKQNTQSDVLIVCINNGYCSSTTVCNASVFDPDNLVIKDGVQATQASSLAYFNITLNSTQTSKLGEYQVTGFCKDGSVAKEIDFPFTVTKTGKEFTIPESIIYIILTISVFLMFLFSVWGAIGLPARNRRNELDRVIGIEIMKYPKIGCMFLSYAFFTWFINILLILSMNLVTLTQYQGFFTMIFNFLMAGLYALFVAMIVIFFILAARDLKLQDLLTRGIQPK